MDFGRFVPRTTADQVADGAHFLGLLLALSLIVKLVGWNVQPTWEAISLMGTLFAGGTLVQKYTGTPGQ